MPGKDGTGPKFEGRREKGKGNGRRSQTVNNCTCPNCGKNIPHKQGHPCNQIQCPDCKVMLVAER